MKRFVIVVIVLLILLTGCKKSVTYYQPSGIVADMSGYEIEDGQFVEITISEILALLDNSKVTTIVYMGYDSCNWCRNLVPTLNEVSLEKELKIYYMNLYADINYSNKEKIFDIAEKCVEAGLMSEEDVEDGFYFPTILYIREGKIVDIHTGTVSGHNANEGDLTEKQQARLKYQLEKEFDELLEG